jgi:hypothetical protein
VVARQAHNLEVAGSNPAPAILVQTRTRGQRMKVGISIAGDPNTGEVQVSGAINDMRIVYWLLGEAKRLIEKRAAKREADDKSGIVVVKGNLNG